MTAEAAAEKRIPAPVQKIVLAVVEEGLLSEAREVRWREWPGGALLVDIVTGSSSRALQNRFKHVRTEIELLENSIILRMLPRRRAQALQPGESSVQLTPQIDAI